MPKDKKPAAPDNQRTPEETAQMAKRVMKVMLETAPEPHTRMQRRAKRARQAAKSKATR
jgi:hypothetical protein